MRYSILGLALVLTACGNESGFSGHNGRQDDTSAPRSVDEGVPVDSPDATFDERLEREGALSGAIQVSLLWNGPNDLDLWVKSPTGEVLSFNDTRDTRGGYLDVDMNAGGSQSLTPVENVVWVRADAPRGRYSVYVDHFADNGGEWTVPFTVRTKVAGSKKSYAGQATGGSGGPDTAMHGAVQVCTFDY